MCSHSVEAQPVVRPHIMSWAFLLPATKLSGVIGNCDNLSMTSGFRETSISIPTKSFSHVTHCCLCFEDSCDAFSKCWILYSICFNFSSYSLFSFWRSFSHIPSSPFHVLSSPVEALSATSSINLSCISWNSLFLHPEMMFCPLSFCRCRLVDSHLCERKREIETENYKITCTYVIITHFCKLSGC